MLKSWKTNFVDYDSKNKPINFKPRSIQPFSLLAIGPSNSGKSYFIRSIYTNHLANRFDHVILISATEQYNHQYDYINNKLVFSVYNSNIISNIKLCQESRIKAGKKLLNVLLIFDDLMNKQMLKCDGLASLYTMGRHFGMSVIFSTQKITLSNTIMRCNSNIIFATKLGGNDKEYLNKEMMSPNIDKHEFGDRKVSDISDILTNLCWGEKYRALVIDNRNYFDSTFNRIFYYKAP